VAAGVGAVAWSAAGLPPPGFLLRHGARSGCAPSGRTIEVEGVEFVEILPGYFRMGSRAGSGNLLGRICAPLGLPWGRPPEPSNEAPVHWVEFPDGFWIARTEVTVGQYAPSDPVRYPRDWPGFRRDWGTDTAMVNVSFVQANWYCEWLAERSGLPIRLPSESEWECACRAGGEGEYSYGDDVERLADYASFRSASPFRGGGYSVATWPIPDTVAIRRANAWGLHDLHGNVEEWCADAWFDSYEGAPVDGTAREIEGSRWRVVRGGSCRTGPDECRSAHRKRSWYLEGTGDRGFRPAFRLPPGAKLPGTR
jgi:formylglycine-generating enzyme required for sulfatase activity